MAPLPDAASASYERISSLFGSISARSTAALYTSSDRVKRAFIIARGTIQHGNGTTSPESIPNPAVFVLFGLIGAGFVCTGIWFFFFAKNGGFYFHENDWEDYKTVVLRRKGPNGTTLSGGTRTTDLGGGSIVGKKQRRRTKRYKDFDDVDLESSIGTASEMSEIKAGKGRKKGKSNKKSGMRGGGANYDDTETVVSEQPDEVVRAYRHEKPARVGGLNKQSDGSAFDGSTADGSTMDNQSQAGLLDNREKTPTSTPTKKNNMGIRQVQPSTTFWPSASKKKKAEAEAEEAARIKAEARKLQEKGRAARREMSFSQGDESSIAGGDRRAARRQSRSPEKRVPGSWNGSELGSDLSGTKSYHHPLPGLGASYADERRRARAAAGGGGGGGGYRRGRRDELSDSDEN